MSDSLDALRAPMEGARLARQAGGEMPPLRSGAPVGEVMDRIYRRQRHIYDLTRKHFLLGRDEAIRALDPPPGGGSVLEIGCGTGRNLIAAAHAWPGVALYGLDISMSMLTTARANIRRAGLGGRIELAPGDAASFDAERLFGRCVFDRVFFSYSLSMIPTWRDAAGLAIGVAAPAGGRVLAVDFGRQERLPGWFRRLFFAWLARFHVAPREDLEAALAALAAANGCAFAWRPLHRGYAQLAEIRRDASTA